MAKKNMLVLLTELMTILPKWMEYTIDWHGMKSPKQGPQLMWRRWKLSWVVILCTLTKDTECAILQTPDGILTIIEGNGILHLGTKQDTIFKKTESIPIHTNEPFIITNIQEDDYFYIEPIDSSISFLIIANLKKDKGMFWKKELPEAVLTADEKIMLKIFNDALLLT